MINLSLPEWSRCDYVKGCAWVNFSRGEIFWE